MMSERLMIRSNNDDRVLFRVFRVLYPADAGGERPYYDHHHPELEISCIQQGSGIFTCEGIDYPFKAGDVFLHCGNDTHCFHRIASDPQLTMLVFQFEQRQIWALGGEWFEPAYLQLFSGGGSIGHYVPGSTPEAQTICHLLQESFDECRDQQPAYQMLVKAKLLAMLANLVRYFHQDLPEESGLPNSRHMEQIERSMQYILKHLDEPFSLDDLAREAQMSRSYFSSSFRKLNGVSVWDYITSKRVELAQQLLETTDNSILDISGSCGYNNISNFNRAFRRVTGKTPREYRKENPKSSAKRTE